MLTVEEALDRLLHDLPLTDIESLPLAEALGRVPTPEPVSATHDVPPFANSAMDGFALRAADGVERRRLVGESRAGGPAPPPVEPGTAVRIMTGAPVPNGADSVVPIETASEANGWLEVERAPEEGAYVRAAGHDLSAGVGFRLPAAPITPAVIGLLAAMGHDTVEVRRPPRVAILSTGDELVANGTPLGLGQIHDANGPALAAAVADAGGVPVLLQPAHDDPTEIERRVREGVAVADILVVSGGVSVGEHDHVRGIIQRIGSLDFWRIAVQPGKPLAAGRVGMVPIVGLPGNPVSALVTFELFVRPMLRRMLGASGDGRVRVVARVDETLPKDPARRAYLRVHLSGDTDGYRAVSAGGQASSQLVPLATANALLVVPAGLSATEPGDSYEAIVTGGIE